MIPYPLLLYHTCSLTLLFSFPFPITPFLLSCLLFSPFLNSFLPYSPFLLSCLLLSPSLSFHYPSLSTPTPSLNSFRQYLPPFPLPFPPLLSTHFHFPKLHCFLSPFLLSCQLLLSLSPFLPSSFHCPPTFPIPLPSSMSFSFPLPFPVPLPSLSPFLYVPSPSLFFSLFILPFSSLEPLLRLSLLYPPFHASSTKVMRRD